MRHSVGLVLIAAICGPSVAFADGSMTWEQAAEAATLYELLVGTCKDRIEQGASEADTLMACEQAVTYSQQMNKITEWTKKQPRSSVSENRLEILRYINAVKRAEKDVQYAVERGWLGK